MNAITADATRRANARSYLYGPVWDFLLLGGGSLVALIPIIAALSFDDMPIETSLTATFALANLVNHPHFAHSYQIFYGGFRDKLTRYPQTLRRMYFLCGIALPVLLAGLLCAPIALGSPIALGRFVNVMFFFVGWHYVKQGYGMAIVDAVLKRSFYDESEKRALMHNAYAVWMLAWLATNALIEDQRDYWGIPYASLPLPAWLPWLSAFTACLTTVRLVGALWRRRAAGKPIAANGLIAYAVSLYAWLLVRHPIVVIWVPLFHSLQYMAVVWRFQLNRSSQHPGRLSSMLRNILFAVSAIALGYLGFWMLPHWLDRHIAYDRTLFGTELFLFLFWVFINIHHYFLDTVMWRKGNPDVQTHLFGAAQ